MRVGFPYHENTKGRKHESRFPFSCFLGFRAFVMKKGS